MDSELQREMWSIVDAGKVRAINLTYAAAQAKLGELMLDENDNSGLTIVTNEAAAQMNQSKSCILKGGANGK